jgi:hypothetical protein
MLGKGVPARLHKATAMQHVDYLKQQPVYCYNLGDFSCRFRLVEAIAKQPFTDRLQQKVAG